MRPTIYSRTSASPLSFAKKARDLEFCIYKAHIGQIMSQWHNDRLLSKVKKAGAGQQTCALSSSSRMKGKVLRSKWLEEPWEWSCRSLWWSAMFILTDLKTDVVIKGERGNLPQITFCKHFSCLDQRSYESVRVQPKFDPLPWLVSDWWRTCAEYYGQIFPSGHSRYRIKTIPFAQMRVS